MYGHCLRSRHTHVPHITSRRLRPVPRFTPHVSFCLALAALLLAGCVAPIGADRVSTRLAYDQVDANALRTGKPSAATASLLHRYELDPLAARHPDQAVRLLHQKALDTGDRDLLFALAELSYVAGEDIRRSVTPWDPRDAREKVHRRFRLSNSAIVFKAPYDEDEQSVEVAVRAAPIASRAHQASHG